MAILKDDQTLFLPKRWADLSTFTISDESEYTDVVGNGRDDAARVMVAAKMTETQVLTFITGLDNTDPLDTLEWEITIASDATEGTTIGEGAYRFFYFNILFYNVLTTYQWEVRDADNVITQYGSIIYVAGVFYTPKVATVTAVQPGVTLDWADSWSIYDIADLSEQILSDQLDIHIHDDIFTGNFEDCILEEFDTMTEDQLCGICVTPDRLAKLNEMEFLLDAANSQNWQEKAYRSETILTEALRKYCGC